MNSTPPSTPPRGNTNRNNPPPVARRRGRERGRGRRLRQPDFGVDRPDGKDPNSGYDGPGEDPKKDKKQPEQPDIKF